MTEPRLAILGAGSRGLGYAQLAAAQGARITAVVDPDPARVAALLAALPDQYVRVLDSWQDLAAHRALADAVVIATPDRAHAEPAIGLAEAGFHLLVEKPMASTEDEARAMVDAARRNGVLLIVCHVLRYSDYSQRLFALVDQGRIGDLVSVEHLEPIGWWHFAHSYVRGNWAREETSSPMLMAKSSHDVDWLIRLVGRPVEEVSSFGGLFHFRPENKPPQAAERCIDCPLQNDCAYSATRIYRGFLGQPAYQRWPLAVLDPVVSPENIERALETGPYGECVYLGRNDVADHQVVNFQFAGGATASFTVTAFTDLDFRKTRVFGTRGSIEGDGRTLQVHDFVTGAQETIAIDVDGSGSAADGHGGADGALVRDFLHALRTGDASRLSTPEESLVSHQVVWAAERSRASSATVRMPADPASVTALPI
jgi:predicted dehydrogenase